MRTLQDISDPRLVKALSHPLRIQILRHMEAGEWSPSEIAEELDAPLGNVSYHVRQLAELGLISLVRETPVRGTLEHHYRAEVRAPHTGKAWAELPEGIATAATAASLAEIGLSANAAASDGGFTRRDAHLLRVPLTLDEDGWKAVADAAREFERAAARIAALAKKRLTKKGGEGEDRAVLVLMLYGQAQDPQKLPAAKRSRRRGRAAGKRA